MNKFYKNEYIVYSKTGKIGKIIDIHYDDNPPYYTIFLRNEKREIQTVEKYLSKIKSKLNELKLKKTRKKLYNKKLYFTKKNYKLHF